MSIKDDAVSRAQEALWQAKADAVLTAGLEVCEVTTTVRLQPSVMAAIDIPGEGPASFVEVAVTRFVTGTDDEDRDGPYFTARVFVRPHDRRRAAGWTYVPAEVAEKLIVRALTS